MSESLRIVVCVRPPDGDTAHPSLGTLDLLAVEYAVQLARRRESSIVTAVTAVAAGGDASVELLRECHARGVDAVVHAPVATPQEDSLAAARVLADVVSELAPQLVLCGDRSDAGMHGAVPRELARLLGIPFVGAVAELSINTRDDGVAARVVQRLERGDRWVWGSTLPLVCGVERDICTPRYLAVRRRRRSGSVTPVTAATDGYALDGDSYRPGPLVVEGRQAPRIRPKKAKVTTAAMSAADRMKLLRGGGKVSAPTGQDDDQPKRVVGDPQAAAAEIIRLLEKKDLLKR